jgi:uncharacterized protein YaiL (DUF2058 family)
MALEVVCTLSCEVTTYSIKLKEKIMGNSLQDQLLAMGLTNKKKAKEAEKAKNKNKKAARKGEEVIDQAKVDAEKARQEKLERDKALNAEKKAQEEAKAIAAQVKQLIKMNSIQVEGELAYNFTAGSKIKKIYVNEDIQDRLSRGKLAIASLDNSFVIIPLGVVDKIRQRDEDTFIYIAENTSQEVDEDDPYADYQIPDDLMW